MFDINDSYQLIYKDNLRNELIFDQQIIDNLNSCDISKLPKDAIVSFEELESILIKFNDNTTLKLFRFPVSCKFKDLNDPIQIVSDIHLKIILEKKIKENIYKKPYYFSKINYQNKSLELNNIKNIAIYAEKYIEIKDEEEPINYEPKIKELFNKLKNIYSQKKITYNMLSPNFKQYISNIKINLEDEFFIIYSLGRNILKEKIENFLNESNSFIYPICGPHGTGKTISALIYHKNLFKKNIKGIYLNLKYYSNHKVTFKEKIETLINECFFICENEGDLLSLYQQFQSKNNFYDIFFILEDYIKNKNENIKKEEKEEKEKLNKEKINNPSNKENEENIKKENNKKDENNNKMIYIIIDQYQKKYDPYNYIDLFKNIKIILFSSINDFDVKENVILKYEYEENNKINEINKPQKILRYHYIDDLITDNYYKSENFKKLLINKINKKDEKEVNEELEFIYYILGKFGFIPKYFFKFIYCYDSIIDLLFHEYSNISKKLHKFIFDKNISINTIEEMQKNKNLIKTKEISSVQTLPKNDFLRYIKWIPLKYINFKECDNKQFYFYYSFPYFKKILDEFIYFEKHKKIYYTSTSGSDRGKIFENLIKYQFKVHRKFNIDGYIKVNTLIDMKLTKKYNNFNKDYISSKENIFIDQKEDGKDFDFAIYKQKSKQLILFQAKYLIDSNNLKFQKSIYSSSALKALTSFNNLINDNIGEVYLLFISSIFYNYDIRKQVIEDLTKKRINCIFYSLINDSFYFNFKDDINEIQLNNSYMLIPSNQFYTPQIALNNSDFEKEDQYYFKYNKKEIESKILELSSKKEDKLKKNKQDKKSCDKILLQKKRIRGKKEDALNVYDGIMKFIKEKTSLDKDIVNKLGNLYLIDNTEQEVDFITDYVFIFYVEKNTFKLDLNKEIGLILKDKGVSYYIDIKKNIAYNSFNELIKNYSDDFLFGIGYKK